MTTDVDTHDDDDATTTELAVAAAVAEVLAHPPDARTVTASQVESLLEAVSGVTLRFYAQRTLQAFVTTWRAGRPISDFDYRSIQEAVDYSVSHAIDETGESVRDIVRAAGEKARGPIVIEQGLDREAEAYQRLHTGMNSISRLLTTRTREIAKFQYATQVGAVGKAWRTRRDGRVRTTHGDLEGDFVLLDEYFTTVAGNKIRRPGDPQAPLSETINCRCRLSYRLPV